MPVKIRKPFMVVTSGRLAANSLPAHTLNLLSAFRCPQWGSLEFCVVSVTTEPSCKGFSAISAEGLTRISFGLDSKRRAKRTARASEASGFATIINSCEVVWWSGTYSNHCAHWLDLCQTAAAARSVCPRFRLAFCDDQPAEVLGTSDHLPNLT